MRWTSRIRHLRTPADDSPAVGRAALAEPEPEPADSAFHVGEAVTLQHRTDVPEGCRVAVLGPPGLLRSLSAALPNSWRLERIDEVGDLTVADLVVVTAPTPGKLSAISARQPDASIVALVSPAARVDAVVEQLQSGATACVRSGEAELVAAHLVACARRYSVGLR